MSANTFTPKILLPRLSNDTKGGVYEFNRLLVRATENLYLLVVDVQSTPPLNPSDGDIYFVEAQGAGSWLGKSNAIAYFDNGWHFADLSRESGALYWDENLDILRTRNNTVFFGSATIASGPADLSAVQTKFNLILTECRGHGLVLN